MSTGETNPRYWTHEEVSDEAARLSRAEDLVGHAVEDLSALPSLSGEIAGDHAATRTFVEDLRGTLSRLHEIAGEAAEAAADSYADECERHASALWDEWETRH